MAVMRLKHVHSYKDRHGKRWAYLRIPGRPSIRLAGAPGSPEFMASYAKAIDGLPPRERPGDGAPGSIRALLEAYYRSADFRAALKSEATRRSHKGVLERFAAMTVDGARVDTFPAATMEKSDFLMLMDELADSPGAAETMLKRVRKLFNFAKERKLATTNPTEGVKSPRDSEGHEAWSDDDVGMFEARWPSGTRQRLAIALLLYTGQRRSDVARMGRQHVKDGMISVTQDKGGARLWIPIHAKLQAELPEAGLSFLMTEHGLPFSTGGFGNWFGAAAKSAGLVKRTAHGLRKSAAYRLAEAGCSGHQIMSITGHRTLAEVERYTRAASQITMAKQAVERMK